jgi:hypothetical protein
MTINAPNYVQESSIGVPEIPREPFIPEPRIEGEDRLFVTTRVMPVEDVERQLRWGNALLEQEPQIQLYINSTPLTLTLKDMTIVGRYNAANKSHPDLDLDPYDAVNSGVSRQHAAFVVEDRIIKIMDMNSANGTFLNGYKLWPYQARVLRDGDEIHFGRMAVRVKFATPLAI